MQSGAGLPIVQFTRSAITAGPSALVIGGGVAGMTAALLIADSGYDVHLVERSEMLGGNLQNMYYVAEGYNPRRLGRDLINRVRSHPRIRSMTRTEMVSNQGTLDSSNLTCETTLPDGILKRPSASSTG